MQHAKFCKILFLCCSTWNTYSGCVKKKTVSVTPQGHLLTSESKEFRTTITLDGQEVELLEKLVESYGALKPSYAQVFKMLIADSLRKVAQSKGWSGQSR